MARDAARRAGPRRAARAAAGGVSVLQGLERAGLRAHDSRARPASDAVLRRLVRRQLGQQRPVRRRHHPRLDPVSREAVPRHRRAVGARADRRIDRRVGGLRRPAVLPRRLQRRVGALSRPDRFPIVSLGEHLRRAQRLLLRRQPLEENAEAWLSRLPRSSLLDVRGSQSRRARPRHARPFGGAARRVGVGVRTGRRRWVLQAAV